MAKKSLTELLHEEAEKSAQPQVEILPKSSDDEVSDQKVAMNKPASSSTKRSNPTKADLEATIKELRQALEEAQQREDTIVDLQDSLEKAQEKEDVIAELKTSLEEAQKKESNLQKEIENLQADLQQQHKYIKQLEEDIQKTDQLKIELEQAKKDALKLAEVNEKLSKKASSSQKKEVSALKQPRQSAQHHQITRPVTKESEKPGDFAKKTWLL